MSDVPNAGIGTHRDHVPNHYVGGFHDTSPLHDQLLSRAGEFFDLNQEMGTVFRGSLAPISRMRGTEVRMRSKHLMLAVVIALAMPAGHGAGREIGQPSRGVVVGERLCAEGHAVPQGYLRSPAACGPVCQAIAA